MNLVAFGLILICCHAWAIEIDDNFLAAGTYKGRTKLENFLEGFKSTIRKGDSRLGIPPLDPFTADKLPIELNQSGKINLKALLTNVKVDGLSSYNVNSADFNLFGLKVHADINWPFVIGSANYSVEGNAFNFEIFGNGGMDAAAHDFRFQIEVAFVLKGNHIQIKSMSPKVSLRALDFHATGIYNSNVETSEIISKTISDMIPSLINKYQMELADTIKGIAIPMVNKYLSTISLKDLIKMLGL